MSSTRRELDLPARVHHHHPVGDAGDDAEVVGDQQDRRARAVLDALEHVEHLRLDRDVERGRRLVGDEQVGIVRDRHRDHRPLAHAARVLVRILVGAAARRGDADEVEQLDRRGRAASLLEMSWCTVIASAIWSPTVNTGFSAASASWKIIAILAPRTLAQLLVRLRRAGPRRGTRPRPLIRADFGQQAEDRQRRDALARARLPDDAERLCLVHVEAHAVDRVHDAVVGRELDPQIAHRQDDVADRELGLAFVDCERRDREIALVELVRLVRRQRLDRRLRRSLRAPGGRGGRTRRGGRRRGSSRTAR